MNREQAAEFLTAVAAFMERRENPPERIVDSKLYAGSPMHIYCRFCGHLSATLPEMYDPANYPNRHVCAPCQELLDKGWMPPVPEF